MSPFSCIKVANAVFCLSSSFGRKYLYVGQNNIIVPLPHLISQNLPIMNLSSFSEQLLLINNIFIAVKEKQVAVLSWIVLPWNSKTFSLFITCYLISRKYKVCFREGMFFEVHSFLRWFLENFLSVFSKAFVIAPVVTRNFWVLVIWKHCFVTSWGISRVHQNWSFCSTCTVLFPLK